MVELEKKKPNASPMWELLYKNEICGARVITTPAPLKGTPAEMLEYCKVFAADVGKAYKVAKTNI